MRGSIAIGISAGIASVFTHGMVFSAVNFNDPLPVPPYQGFFRHLVLATERVWSYTHGWPPLSHIRDFGPFYAPAVELGCPLLGFALFRMLSREKVGTNVWKPLAIAALLSMAPDVLSGASAAALPWWEAARTAAIVFAMAWSVGAIRLFPGSRALAPGARSCPLEP